MIGAAAVHTDPAELLRLGPISKFTIGTGVFDHITDFISGIVIPSEMMVPSMDDENIPFFYLHPILDHLAGIDLVISNGIAQINHNPFIDQEVHLQLSDIFAWGIEMDFAI